MVLTHPVLNVVGFTIDDARGLGVVAANLGRAEHTVDAAIRVCEACGRARGGATRTAALIAPKRAAHVAVVIRPFDSDSVEAEARDDCSSSEQGSQPNRSNR